MIDEAGLRAALQRPDSLVNVDAAWVLNSHLVSRRRIRRRVAAGVSLLAIVVAGIPAGIGLHLNEYRDPNAAARPSTLALHAAKGGDFSWRALGTTKGTTTTSLFASDTTSFAGNAGQWLFWIDPAGGSPCVSFATTRSRVVEYTSCTGADLPRAFDYAGWPGAVTATQGSGGMTVWFKLVRPNVAYTRQVDARGPGLETVILQPPGLPYARFVSETWYGCQRFDGFDAGGVRVWSWEPESRCSPPKEIQRGNPPDSQRPGL